MHFDWVTIATAVLSFVGGIGAVAAFAGKWLPVTQKYMGIAQDILIVTNTFLAAAKPDVDGKVTFTTEEMASIKAAVEKLTADFHK